MGGADFVIGVPQYVEPIVPSLLVIVFSTFSSHGATAETPWRFLREVDGVAVCKCSYPDSDVDMFKGISVVNASIAVVADILRDLPAYPQWMANGMLGRVEKYFDANNMIVYNVIDFPIDPQGNLPAFLVNAVLKDVPGKSLINLKRMASKDKYQHADPLGENNFETTRKVMAVHLKRFIKDERIIEKFCFFINVSGWFAFGWSGFATDVVWHGDSSAGIEAPP